MYVSFENLGTYGRLGNQLWQIASTMGIAQAKTGSYRNACFPEWSYAPYFSVPSEFFSLKDPREDLGLNHFQEIQYFAPIESIVREYFTPSEQAEELLRQYFAHLLELEDPIALHVRRGDAIGKEYWHPVAAAQYYADGLARLPSRPVIVFSDGIEWAQEHLKNFASEMYYCSPILEDVFGENPMDVFELLLMTKCKHHIISNSTFSWWGAYLSQDSAVVYPSNWYGPGHAHINWRLMIPQGWIEVAS